MSDRETGGYSVRIEPIEGDRGDEAQQGSGASPHQRHESKEGESGDYHVHIDFSGPVPPHGPGGEHILIPLPLPQSGGRPHRLRIRVEADLPDLFSGPVPGHRQSLGEQWEYTVHVDSTDSEAAAAGGEASQRVVRSYKVHTSPNR